MDWWRLCLREHVRNVMARRLGREAQMMPTFTSMLDKKAAGPLCLLTSALVAMVYRGPSLAIETRHTLFVFSQHIIFIPADGVVVLLTILRVQRRLSSLPFDDKVD